MLKVILRIKISTSVISTLIAFLLCFLTSTAHAALPKTADGWTIFTPSEDSLIVYVSNDGNDETAETYTRRELGNSPFTPPDNMTLHSFKTFKAAFEKTRRNKPDWVLIKRGDTFFEIIKVQNGKSLTEPFLIAAYGENSANPVFNTGNKTALKMCCNTYNNIAIQGLDFYAHTRDPASPYYLSASGRAGLAIYVNKERQIENLLIEGNRFRFYGGNVAQGLGTFKNVILRRNSFLDSYSTKNHSQGLYAANISLTLEENIFVHNGWLIQASEIAGKKQGAATMFNHNTYFADTHNVKFISNIFINPSSMHNKWTANKGKHSSSNVIIKNNLYIDGEIGISAGGNEAGAYRFKNYQITDNVMLNIGHSQPTARSLGWGLEIKDWDGGIVKNNYFLNQVNPQVTNTFGIKITGTTKDVEIENNKFDNLLSDNAMVLGTGGSKENIDINKNQFAFKENGETLIRINDNLAGYSFQDNQYFHEAGPHKTHVTAETKSSLWQEIFRLHDEDNFVSWIALTKERNNQWVKTPIKEQRTIESYMASLDKKAAIDAFIKELRNMSKENWDPRFTAESINRYIKLGYAQ